MVCSLFLPSNPLTILLTSLLYTKMYARCIHDVYSVIIITFAFRFIYTAATEVSDQLGDTRDVTSTACVHMERYIEYCNNIIMNKYDPLKTLL